MESNDRDYSHLPDAVRRQGEEADALMDELMKGEGNTQDDQAGKTASDAEQGAEGQAAGDQVSAADPENQGSNAGEAKPDGSADKGAQNEEEETFRKRYEVLSGKYGAEVPRLHQQINELTKQVADLAAALAAQGRKPESAQERKPDQQMAKTPKLDPKKLADFGEDFESVGEIVNSLADQLEALKQENQTMRQALGGVQQYTAQSAEERFASGLSAEVPNWQQVNNDPLFWAFLDQVNPYTGQPMRDALNDAASKRDDKRAAFIFKQFFTQSGAAPSAQQQGQNGQTSQGKSMDRQAKLERELSPGKSKSGATQDKKQIVWDENTIEKFLDDVARGKIPDKEAARLEADMFAYIGRQNV
jgi:hypothetical protein